MRRASVARSVLLSVTVLGLADDGGRGGLVLSRPNACSRTNAGPPNTRNRAPCSTIPRPQRLPMEGLPLKLAVLCGRPDLLGRVAQEENESPPGEALGTDVRANDPTGDTDASRTQNETAIARNETNGTLCSAYNDSYSGVTQGFGYTGFSRSVDGAATWSDRGAVPAGGGGLSFGDPALVGRKSDGRFYLRHVAHERHCAVALRRRLPKLLLLRHGLTPARMTTRSLMAVDNNPAIPHYGRLYVAWTDFTDGRYSGLPTPATAARPGRPRS